MILLSDTSKIISEKPRKIKHFIAYLLLNSLSRPSTSAPPRDVNGSRPNTARAQMSMNRSLPFDCPRGLSRIDAAAYIGVSPGTFDSFVKEGRMPKPTRLRNRLVWDRVELDSAFNAFGETNDNDNNDWD